MHTKTTIITIFIFLVICAIELITILKLNDGKFSYTLDDAYIHLALSENIARGHYGVNSNEASAPSSSIIWPFLLAPFAKLSVGPYMPLLFNLLSASATLLVFGKILETALAHNQTQFKPRITFTILIILMLGTNMVGLVFTGMEHSLQVLLSSLLVWGLIIEHKTRTPPRWLVIVLIAGPLVRYENLALILPALIYLSIRRHYRLVAIAGIGLAFSLGIFTLFTYQLIGELLPSSVLAKSGVSDAATHAGELLIELIINILMNIVSSAGIILIAGVWLLVRYARAVNSENRQLAAWIGGAVLLHFCFGRPGWYYRYEIYIITALILPLIYFYLDPHWQSTKKSRRVTYRLWAIIGAAAISTYLYPLITTPIASNNIYSQQYQMHRFIVDYYQKSVAVNDLGWATYDNQQYVVDLGGLANQEALKAIQHENDSAWMNRIVSKHDVHLAMIYDHWFKNVPENWLKVGELHLTHDLPRITPASDTVTFYALDEETRVLTEALLIKFSLTLPDTAYIVIESDNPTERAETLHE